mgnify:CR=1 FL=1
MKADDVEKVMRVITSMFKLPSDQSSRLKEKLRELELSSTTKPLRYSWIEEARSVAVRIATDSGEVTIEDVLSELPLPADCDPRIVGGVFRHPDFKRINSRVLKAADGRYKTVGVFALVASRPQPITDWD